MKGKNCVAIASDTRYGVQVATNYLRVLSPHPELRRKLLQWTSLKYSKWTTVWWSASPASWPILRLCKLESSSLPRLLRISLALKNSATMSISINCVRNAIWSLKLSQIWSPQCVCWFSAVKSNLTILSVWTPLWSVVCRAYRCWPERW